MKPGLWNFVSIAIGVLGVGLAIYFNFINQKEREPAYLPIKGLLVYASQSSIETPKYKMVWADESQEKPIVGNVYVQELAFWNKGELPLEKRDVLSPLGFKYPEEVTVIDAFVSESNRAKVVNPSVSFDGRDVGFSFDILEMGEGFKLQVVFASPEYAKPEIYGDIKGVREFDGRSELTRDNLIYGAAMVALWGVVIALAFLAAAFFVDKFDSIIKRIAPGKEEKIKKNLDKLGSVFTAILVGFFILLFAVGKAYDFAESEANNSVPEMDQYPSVRPT